MYRIELFGGLRLLCNDQLVQSLATRKAGVLLAYLSCFPERMHSREQLAEILWPDVDPVTGRNRLKQELSRIRRSVEQEGFPLFVAGRNSVGLNASLVCSDVAEFKDIVAQQRDPHYADRITLLRRAITLYTGDFLPDCYDDWALNEREWLRECYRTIGIEAARELHRLHQDQDAREVLLKLVQTDPLCEESCQELMRFHLAHGQRGEAYRAYQRLEERLLRDLQMAPCQASRHLADCCHQSSTEEETTTSKLSLSALSTTLLPLPPPDPPLEMSAESCSEQEMPAPATFQSQRQRSHSFPGPVLWMGALPSVFCLFVLLLLLREKRSAYFTVATDQPVIATNERPVQNNPILPRQVMNNEKVQGAIREAKQTIKPTAPLMKLSDRKRKPSTYPPFKQEARQYLLSSVSPPRYQVQGLGHLPLDGTSFAIAINNANRVVGISAKDERLQICHAFYWDEEQGLTLLQGPLDSTTANAISPDGHIIGSDGATAFLWRLESEGKGYSGQTINLCNAFDMNEAGHCVGYTRQTGATHAALYAESTGLQDLQAEGIRLAGNHYIKSSVACGINIRDQVVGSMETDEGMRAFFWQQDQGMEALELLPDCITNEAAAINDAGDIVGSARTSTSHKIPYISRFDGQKRTVQPIPLPISSDGQAGAINNEGVVVGQYTFKEEARAFLWRPGQPAVDLTSVLPPHSGWILLEARGINDNGWIVGRGRHQGKIEAFLLRPIPLSRATAR